MSILIEHNLCKGCGICADLCPEAVLSINQLGKVEALQDENCTQCRQCEQHCPDYAIGSWRTEQNCRDSLRAIADPVCDPACAEGDRRNQ